MTAAIIIGGFAAIFIMSVVLHEVAHGYVAYRLGDPTAYLMGRLTLNPIKHVDPMWTLIIPAVFLYMGLPVIGGAKPVPVNPNNLKHPRRDDRLVSSAGVVVNLTIAWVLGMTLHGLLKGGVVTLDSPLAVVLGMGAISNMALFLFNLIPIPPLDGSHLLRSALPWHLQAQFDRMRRYGIFVIYALVYLGLGHYLYVAVEWLWRYFLVFRVYEDSFYIILAGFVQVFHTGGS